MKFKFFTVLIFFNIYLYSQQAVLLNAPPGNITLPSVITTENGVPKSTGLGIIDSKWIPVSDANAESLLESYSNSPDKGIRKIINDILSKANVSEENKSKLKISFKSTGTETRSIDKNDVIFGDDFASKYTQDELYLVTKLYRSNNAVLEITENGVTEFDPVIQNNLSEGLRFGNKSETTVENKMIIEIQNLVYAYEYHSFNIERISERELIIPMYYDVNIGINSISAMTVTEGGKNEYYCSISTKYTPKPVGFKISDTEQNFSFRAGGKESYSLKFIEAGGNKIKFSLSGFNITFP